MLEVLVAAGLAINAGVLAWVAKEIYEVRILITGYEHRLSAVEYRLNALEKRKQIKRK